MARRTIRLTRAMLDAMNTALAELLAGEGPQAHGEEEGERVMLEGHKAQAWIWQELKRRDERQAKRRARR